MPTVWFVNHYAGDPRQARSGTRHHSLGVHLVRQGWTVAIVSASTAHPSGLQLAEAKGAVRTAEIDGVHYLWVRTPTYAGNGRRRVLNMTSFALMLLRPRLLIRLPRPDVVVGSTVHPLAAWAASVLAKRRRVPFVFEVRDLWPETLIQMGAISRTHILARALARLEARLCRSAVAIVTTMPLAVDYYSRRGVNASKVHWISNGVEPEMFDPAPRPPGSTFTFTYFGSLGRANGVALIVEGFARSIKLSDLPLRLRLVGGGAELPALKELVIRFGLAEAITFHDPVPKAEIPSIAAEADALIACMLPLPLYDYGISLNKLFEYLAAGRPIVFAGSAKGNPVAPATGVELCEPSVHGIADAMVRVARLSPDQLAQRGAANRVFAEEHFSYLELSVRYAAILASVSTALDEGFRDHDSQA